MIMMGERDQVDDEKKKETEEDRRRRQKKKTEEKEVGQGGAIFVKATEEQ